MGRTYRRMDKDAKATWGRSVEGNTRKARSRREDKNYGGASHKPRGGAKNKSNWSDSDWD